MPPLPKEPPLVLVPPVSSEPPFPLAPPEEEPGAPAPPLPPPGLFALEHASSDWLANRMPARVVFCAVRRSLLSMRM
jgi:hypothetical protein